MDMLTASHETRNADGENRTATTVPDSLAVTGRPTFRNGDNFSPEANHDRLSLTRQARGILERAERERRGLNAEERQTLDRIEGDIANLDNAAEVVARLGRMRNQERGELEIAGRRVDAARRAASADSTRTVRRAAEEALAGDDDDNDPWRELDVREARSIMRQCYRGWSGNGPFGRLTSQREYEQAFDRTIRGDVMSLREFMAERPELFAGPERRAISNATTNAPVPLVWEANIVRELQALVTMRTLCPVFNSDTDRKIPIGVTRAAATWWGENPGSDYTANDPTFDVVTVDAYMAGVITSVHQTNLDDASIDMQAFIMAEQADALGELLEAGYVDGAGSGNAPAGFIGQMDSGTIATTAATGAFTSDEILNLAHAVPAKWRADSANFRWLLGDATLLSIRKLKNTINDYIWKGSERYSDIRDGIPGLIDGKPYAVSDSMPTTGTTKPVIIIGNFKKCQIWDRGPTRMLINPYTQSRRLFVDFQAWRRTDIKIVKKAAFAGLKLKA